MATTTTKQQGQEQNRIDPSQAQGAQIPLQTFHIPNFPPEAQSLQALTLTSDIKTDEYQTLLSQPFSIPALPTGIESLTLELFSLGYPAGFLAQLADRLPNLKDVVIYSQLFGGITDESQRDAVEFFRKLEGLRALHLLDVFAKEGFSRDVAKWLRAGEGEGEEKGEGEARRGLMLLEVNYTYRHEDEEFLHRVQATELPDLIGPGLIACSLNISVPDAGGDDEQDPTNIQGVGSKQGVMAFNKSLAPDPMSALTNEEISPQALKALNLTMYTITLDHLELILQKHNQLAVISVTLDVEPGDAFKQKLIRILEEAGCTTLEQIEIVANPTLEFFMAVQNPQHGTMTKTFPSLNDMKRLSGKMQRLSSFKANILKSTSAAAIDYERKDDGWSAVG